MSIITISRQFGSGGDEIAYQVSQALGYRLFDKRMVREAAIASGFSEHAAADDILDYSEDNHKVHTFLDTLFENMSIMSYPGVFLDEQSVLFTAEAMRMQRMDCLHLVQKAVESAYQAGKVVIVGRGGQVLLQDRPDVFHIRVVAPLDTRCQRIRERLNRETNASQQKHYTDDEIKEIATQRDAASADYIQSYYHVHWDDALLYHLVINSGRVPIDQAIQMIIKLAHFQLS